MTAFSDDLRLPRPSPSDDEQFGLVIAVAASAELRVRLAEVVDGGPPLLLVPTLADLRSLLAAAPYQSRPVAVAGTPAGPAAAVTPLPPVAPAAPVRPVATAEPAGPPDRAATRRDLLGVDAARSTASWAGREIGLSRLERALLTCLTSAPGRVWSFDELRRAVWGDSAVQRAGRVESLVKRLRGKLVRLGAGVRIDAVRGVGFRLSDAGPATAGRPEPADPTG